MVLSLNLYSLEIYAVLDSVLQRNSKHSLSQQNGANRLVLHPAFNIQTDLIKGSMFNQSKSRYIKYLVHYTSRVLRLSYFWDVPFHSYISLYMFFYIHRIVIFKMSICCILRVIMVYYELRLEFQQRRFFSQLSVNLGRA